MLNCDELDSFASHLIPWLAWRHLHIPNLSLSSLSLMGHRGPVLREGEDCVTWQT